jgi:hypothetical protein
MMKRAAHGLALLGLGIACSTPAEGPRSTEKTDHPLLAPSVRRLSVAELSAAASSLVGSHVDWNAALPPDARQNDFSRSLSQSVDATTLRQLDAAARQTAAQLDWSAVGLPACAASAVAGDMACAADVVAALASKAFRRAASETELAGLRTLFAAGAEAGTFRDGAELVVRALLGAPAFLYESALGAAEPGAGDFWLSDDELATQLAWLIAGQPPDGELVRAAIGGALRDGARRRQQALRLLQNPAARPLYRRFVEEWLGLHQLRSLAKAASVAPAFATEREAMLAETEAVIDDALMSSGGSLAQLFAGGYSIVPGELAPLYGIAPPAAGQRVSLEPLGRVGLLQQASFLATFAHEEESAPVLRGKAVLERLLCRKLPKPSELGIDLVLPAPDPTATTRQRFAGHAASPRCAGCHDALDGIGFTFENFDAVGRSRSEQSGQAIDTTGVVVIDGQDVPLADSVALARTLATSAELSACAARQVVRFAAGIDAPEVESDFVAATRSLPEAERGSIIGLLLAYTEGDWFARRAAP